MAEDLKQLAAELAAGSRTKVARALNMLDTRRGGENEPEALLEHLHPRAGAHLIGVTGPPGVGKSSLCSALIGLWRGQGKTVGVLAVDPSSQITGGALLGDRVRITRSKPDEGLFIRSLASRGQLGGVSREAWPMSQVMLAAYDRVIVETVGVGQSEQDVASLTDTTCFVVQPASGDVIQFLKAGVMEVPDVFAVNKADLGLPAQQAVDELRRALPAVADGTIPVAAVSSLKGTGIEELAGVFDARLDALADSGELDRKRRTHRTAWVLRQLADEFGSHGISKLGGALKLRERWLAETITAADILREYRDMRRELLGE